METASPTSTHAPTLALYVGSSTGNTEEAARRIADAFARLTGVRADVIEVGRLAPERLLDHDRFVVGCPTWDVGELQADWHRLHARLGDLGFAGRTVALFGYGDSVGYPETFQDAMGVLAREFRRRGATLVGKWPTDGYSFEASRAVEGDHFLGLALDTDDSWRTCCARIDEWVAQVACEMGLPVRAAAAEAAAVAG